MVRGRKNISAKCRGSKSWVSFFGSFGQVSVRLDCLNRLEQDSSGEGNQKRKIVFKNLDKGTRVFAETMLVRFAVPLAFFLFLYRARVVRTCLMHFKGGCSCFCRRRPACPSTFLPRWRAEEATSAAFPILLLLLRDKGSPRGSDSSFQDTLRRGLALHWGQIRYEKKI